MHKSLPSKEIVLVIKNNSYPIKFPTTGEFIDIQALKEKITQDNYSSLANSADYNAGYARVLVDMCATYNILIPDLKRDLNVETILGLSMLESRELVDPYVDTYLPWYTEWMDVITKVKKAPKKEA